MTRNSLLCADFSIRFWNDPGIENDKENKEVIKKLAILKTNLSQVKLKLRVLEVLK